MDDKILSAKDVKGCTEDVCITADQIYDSCRSKECIENLHVYFSPENQSVIDSASKITAESAEVIWVYSDVEPLNFHKGYYTVNMRFYFRIVLNAYTGSKCPVRVDGLAAYEKKTVLFGSEGEAKIFRSEYKEDSFDIASWKKTNLPTAVVSVVDPIVLDTLTVSPCENVCSSSMDISLVPECVHKIFETPVASSPESRQVYVTLGLFMMVRLEREVGLTVPAASFCVPDGTCRAGEEPGAPCDLFDEIAFPVDEFFPPRKSSSPCLCSDKDSSEA